MTVRYVRFVFGVAAVTAIVAPLYLAVAGSFSGASLLQAGSTWWPMQPTLENYRAVWADHELWRPIANSLLVAAVTTFFCVAFGSLCAYALARMRFRGREIVLGLILAISMFPQISIVSPLYLLLRELHLIDTYPGLILPYMTFAMPLAVWLLVGFFRQLPAELEDAARLDGAGTMRILVEIVLPLSRPALATTAILTFLYCWNEFLFALSFTIGPERRTVPVAIALFRGRFQVPWGEILAASVVATIPVVAVVLSFQRRIVAGLTRGAVK